MKNLCPKMLREAGQNESVCLYKRCQPKLQSWKCLCVEICIAAKTVQDFCWLFVETYE